MNISEIHDFINFVADKEMGAYFPHADIDSAIDRSQMIRFNDYIPKNYSPWQEPHMALSPFKRAYDFITSSDGAVDISDASASDDTRPFIYLLSCEVAVADNSLPSGSDTPRWPVDFINEAELAARRNSQLIPISTTSPVMIQTGRTEFQIFPNQEHAGTIRYIRRPAKPVFGYTQVGRVITYNPATSTELEWSEQYLNKIIFGACIFLGMNLDEDKLAKYGADLIAGNV